MSQIHDCACQEKKTLMLPLTGLGLGFDASALPESLSRDEVGRMIEDAIKDALDGLEPETCCTVLHENLTLYVAPDGDDANDGLTPEAPFKSIQAAVDSTCHYVSGGPNVGITIALASGEYNVVNIDFTRHFRNLTLQGQTDHSSRIIGGILAQESGRLILRDIYAESKSGVNGNNAVRIVAGARCYLYNMQLCGNVANAAVLAAYYSEIFAYDMAITTKQKALALFYAVQGRINLFEKVRLMACDATNNLYAITQGIIGFSDNASFEGTCTGRRYLIQRMGLILVNNGLPETAIPGASAGLAQTGGLFCN